MEIIQNPDTRLRTISNPVGMVNPYVEEVIAEIERHLGEKRTSALGLAAIQLGIPLRIIGFWYGQEKLILINPEITKKSPQLFKSIEGCLSVGKGSMTYVVLRNKSIKVRAYGKKMEPMHLRLSSSDSVVVQHEVDHLNGIMISQSGIFLPK